MKKLLLILLCLPMIFSCGVKDKTKKLEDRIAELENKKENKDEGSLDKEITKKENKDEGSLSKEITNVIDNPKSKGLNFSIREPVNFERVDGRRPNILYNWVKNRDNLDNRITISILIGEIPEEIQWTKKEWEQYLELDNGVSDLTEDYEDVNQEKYIVIESYPGVMFNYTNEVQRIDYKRKTHNKMIVLIVEGKFFSFSMSASTKSSLDSNVEIFLSMANSIVFPEQYN